MFRIECFCEDRRVAEVLRALAGLVRGAPSVQPVTNLDEARPARERAATNGRAIDQFAAYIRRARPVEINAEYMRTFMKMIGYAPGGYSGLLAKAQQVGLLKRKPGGKGNSNVVYIITGKATKKKEA